MGTGSVRRKVQLLALRPDLEVVEIRGNIDTRLALVGELDAVVMATAALDRLEISPEVVERLEVETMLPQVGQGTLAIECRVDDHECLEALAMIDDADSHRILDAERSFLIELGGDCDLPAGAYAHLTNDDLVEVKGMLSDGEDQISFETRRGDDGVVAGREVAAHLRERLG